MDSEPLTFLGATSLGGKAAFSGASQAQNILPFQDGGGWMFSGSNEFKGHIAGKEPLQQEDLP